MRKHLLPLFLLVIIIIFIPIPNVHAPTSITFKSFCHVFADTVNTINCTLTGVSTGDTIVVNIYGVGVFNSFTTTDGQGNTYSQKVSSITSSGAGISTY